MRISARNSAERFVICIGNVGLSGIRNDEAAVQQSSSCVRGKGDCLIHAQQRDLHSRNTNH